MAGYLAEPLSDLLLPAEQAALDTLGNFLRLDVRRSYLFWEAIVARMLDGSLTGHKCPWDVELGYGAETIRVEVKSAYETWAQFQVGRRPVLKFAAPKGVGAEKPAHVLVLIGLDELADVYTWVIPAKAIGKRASITMSSPRFRTSHSHPASVDGFRRPAGQLLPEVLRMYRVQRAPDG